MDSSTQLVKALRNLTVAIVSLAALQFLQLCFTGWSIVESYRFARHSTWTSEPSTPLHQPQATATGPAPDLSVAHLTPEELVSRATGIMLVTYSPDGDRLKAVVSEFLKRPPGIVVPYSIGEECLELSVVTKPGYDYGDGQIAFMMGTPAEIRVSYSFSGGRLSGLGGIRIERIRQLLTSTPSATPTHLSH